MEALVTWLNIKSEKEPPWKTLFFHCDVFHLLESKGESHFMF